MKKEFIILVLAGILTNLSAQENYKPSQENLKSREWFQDARFGLFVHWFVYSIMGGGRDMGIAEWIMHRKQIPAEQYEKLPAFFYPVDFSNFFLQINIKSNLPFYFIGS